MENSIKICPYCKCYFEIQQLNCGIFRHAVYIKNNEPINPHESKQHIESLIKKNEIYGCGNPFRIVNGIPIKCDYI